VRRMLIAADGRPVTTEQFVKAIYPRGPWLSWHWRQTRWSAERHAVRVIPRTKPLRWRLKKPVT